MSFELLDKQILALVKEKGFKEPTKAQKTAIEYVLKGDNVLIISPTGTGKTEAAVLPIFDKMLKNDDKRIFCLYITPLKSLNRDILDRIMFWAKNLKLDVEVRHGDTTPYVRSQQAADPPNMLITTPESLQSMIVGKKIREHLKNVEYVIVDEIHELFEDKRGAQLALGLERLKNLKGKDFTRIGLSATVGNKEKVAEFLKGSGKSVRTVEVAGVKEIKAEVDWLEPEGTDFEVAAKIYSTPEVAARLRKILELYDSRNGVLVFVNTREQAEILGSRLKSLTEKTEVHHSSLSRAARLSAEKAFKDKTITGLVATSSMALGIDIGHIDTVVQYMSPRRIDVFLQRVGRSGHALEKIAEGFVLAVDEDDAIEAGAIVKLALSGVLEEPVFPEKPMDVLANQLVGLCFDEKITPEKAFDIVKGSYQFRNLKKSEFTDVLNVLKNLRILRQYETSLGLARPAFNYYFSNLSTIPDTSSFDVVDAATHEKIATVDEEFAAGIEVGDTFIARGACWRVISRDQKLLVEKAPFSARAPEWAGQLMPVDWVVAQEVARMKEKLWGVEKEEAFELLKPNKMNEAAAERVWADVNALGVKPSPKKMVLEVRKDFLVIHSYWGNKVNETLGRVLASWLNLKYGDSVGLRTDQYRIMLQFPGAADVAGVTEALAKMDGNFLESTLRIVLKNSAVFKQRFLHVARRFGIIQSGAEFSKLGIQRLIETYEFSPVFEEALQELFRDKLDVEKTKEVVAGLKSGAIEVEVTEKGSPFARRFIERYLPEVVGGERPKKEVLRLVRERLENRRMTFVCMYKGDWVGSHNLKTVPEACPSCGSKLLGVAWRDDVKLVKKKDLSANEKQRLKRIRKSADLILSYGQKAILALAGRGIGPDTAGRILLKAADEEDLIEKVIEAEKQYARTRVFWD